MLSKRCRLFLRHTETEIQGVNPMASKFDQLKERMKNASKRARESAENIRNAGETVLTAGALGYASGRGVGGANFSVGPVPIDLGVGLGAGAMALYSPGRGSSDLMAIGVGALAHYAARKGTSLGAAHKAEKDKTKKTAGVPRRSAPAARVQQAPMVPMRQQRAA